jgi:hypothetical protein
MGERDELVVRLEAALAQKAVEPQCLRCRATHGWNWFYEPVAEIDPGGAPRLLAVASPNARVCLRCGLIERYDVALLLDGTHDAS